MAVIDTICPKCRERYRPGTEHECAPKRGRGRPPSITDMAAYKAQKQREYRARLKAEKEGKS